MTEKRKPDYTGNDGIAAWNGVDKNGNKTYDWIDLLGKFVDAGWAKNNVDILAKVKINKANVDALKLFDYVEQKMPVGFSIGGNVIEGDE